MTITIEQILDTITEQAKAHDDFIGLVMERYNLPPHEAKEAKYDNDMIDLLLELSDDINERFNYIEALYRDQELDKHAQNWWNAYTGMKEHLSEELANIEEKEEYENAPFDDHETRELLEELYLNEHEAFEAMHQGAKTVFVMSMLG